MGHICYNHHMTSLGLDWTFGLQGFNSRHPLTYPNLGNCFEGGSALLCSVALLMYDNGMGNDIHGLAYLPVRLSR